MKKQFILAIVIFISFCSCNDYKQKEQKETPSNALPTPVADLDTARVKVGEENFRQLVAFIEKKGKLVKDKYGSFLIVSFVDADKNLHEFVIKSGDKTERIQVDGYYKSKKDEEHFFGYDISERDAYPYLFYQSYVIKHISAMRMGYYEFLALAKVQNKKK